MVRSEELFRYRTDMGVSFKADIALVSYTEDPGWAYPKVVPSNLRVISFTD